MHSNFKAAATILMSNYPVEKNQTNLLLETSFFSELFFGYARDAVKVANHFNFTASFVEPRKISFYP